MTLSSSFLNNAFGSPSASPPPQRARHPASVGLRRLIQQHQVTARLFFERRNLERTLQCQPYVADITNALLRVLVQTATQKDKHARGDGVWQGIPPWLAPHNRCERVGDVFAIEPRLPVSIS